MGDDDTVSVMQEVEFIREDGLSYIVTDRNGKQFKLSREFVIVSYGANGRRTFSAQKWYFDKIGLAYGV